MVKNHSLIWILVILALAAFPVIIKAEFFTFLLTEILIMGLFAMSFNLLLGYTGLLSFGHAGFFGLGAYTLTLLITKASFPILLSFFLSLFIPLLFASVIGYFCIQRIKVYFALLSLAFGQIIYTVIFKWYDFTGGDTGIYGIPRPAPFGWELKSTVAFYYFTLPFILLSLASLFVIVRSPFGMILRAIRENPERAEFLAVHVKKYQLLSFIISSFFAAEAGALFVFFQGYAVPIFAHANKTVEAMVMTILGGTYSFIGPIVGAAIVTGLDKILTTYTEYWPLVLGVILLFLSLYLPGGMMGLLEKIRVSFKSKKTEGRG
jgi:branched-chain amino acid transport system permease protein